MSKAKALNRTVSVAPMMDRTDRHCRYFLRLISRQVLLYSEMVPASAVIHGDRDRFLGHDPVEKPLALQLGGSDPSELAVCAGIAEAYGYDEVNLNVGCPSDRVHSGRFGACLMAQPELVARCVAAMRSAVHIPVTVKTRLGIDERDSYEHLTEFIQCVTEAGCSVFILHARKAWLQGLSPKENRQIPPLRHSMVHELKRSFPELAIIINGGFTTLDQVADQLDKVDGVMLGRAVYQNPYLLAAVDRRFFGDTAPMRTREEVARSFQTYINMQIADGAHLKHMVRHAVGLFQGQPGARKWRRYISESVHQHDAGPDVIREALKLIGEPT